MSQRVADHRRRHAGFRQAAPHAAAEAIRSVHLFVAAQSGAGVIRYNSPHIAEFGVGPQKAHKNVFAFAVRTGVENVIGDCVSRGGVKRQCQRLSDAFEKPGGCAEMTAEVYNINYGRNAELMERCRPLRDYSILVEKIRRYRKSGLPVSEAVDRAVEECVREDVLTDFLKVHKAEVIGMLLTEYDQAEHLRLLKEEGIEEGIEQGRAEGIEQGVLHSIKSMMKTLGLSLEAALSALEIPSDKRQTYIDLLNRQGTPNA